MKKITIRSSKELKINFHNDEVYNIYVYSKNKNIKLKVRTTHANNTEGKLFFFLVANYSNIKLDLSSKINPDSIGVKVVHKIRGIVLDNKSSIEVLPILDVNTKNSISEHSIEIGYINKELLFYLNTKGMNNANAKLFLLGKYFKDS